MSDDKSASEEALILRKHLHGQIRKCILDRYFEINEQKCPWSGRTAAALMTSCSITAPVDAAVAVRAHREPTTQRRHQFQRRSCVVDTASSQITVRVQTTRFGKLLDIRSGNGSKGEKLYADAQRILDEANRLVDQRATETDERVANEGVRCHGEDRPGERTSSRISCQTT